MVKSETPRDAETLFENPRPRLESFNKIRAQDSVRGEKTEPENSFCERKTVRSET